MEQTGFTEAAQYVTFKLGDELFALTVSQVKEILENISITRVPRSERYMRGIINVRGRMIPVVDLKLRFGMAQTETGKDSRIMVVERNMAGETLLMGVMADSVHDVIEIESGKIEAPPSVGARLHTTSIKGIGRLDENFILIIDINKVFGPEALSGIKDSITWNPEAENVAAA
jgi:purine-binding chemotaxis protein CheW